MQKNEAVKSAKLKSLSNFLKYYVSSNITDTGEDVFNIGYTSKCDENANLPCLLADWSTSNNPSLKKMLKLSSDPKSPNGFNADLSFFSFKGDEKRLAFVAEKQLHQLLNEVDHYVSCQGEAEAVLNMIDEGGLKTHVLIEKGMNGVIVRSRQCEFFGKLNTMVTNNKNEYLCSSCNDLFQLFRQMNVRSPDKNSKSLGFKLNKGILVSPEDVKLSVLAKKGKQKPPENVSNESTVEIMPALYTKPKSLPQRVKEEDRVNVDFFDEARMSIFNEMGLADDGARQKEYQCSDCTKVFPDKFKLEKHRARLHNEDEGTTIGFKVERRRSNLGNDQVDLDTDLKLERLKLQEQRLLNEEADLTAQINHERQRAGLFGTDDDIDSGFGLENDIPSEFSLENDIAGGLGLKKDISPGFKPERDRKRFTNNQRIEDFIIDRKDAKPIKKPEIVVQKLKKFCFFCDVEFKTFSALISHLYTDHQDKPLEQLTNMIPRIEVEQLNKDGVQNLLGAVKMENELENDSTFRCKFCAYSFEEFANFLSHTKSSHPNEDKSQSHWTLRMNFELEKKWAAKELQQQRAANNISTDRPDRIKSFQTTDQFFSNPYDSISLDTLDTENNSGVVSSMVDETLPESEYDPRPLNNNVIIENVTNEKTATNEKTPDDVISDNETSPDEDEEEEEEEETPTEFKCTSCTKVFPEKAKLEKHRARLHDDEEPPPPPKPKPKKEPKKKVKKEAPSKLKKEFIADLKKEVIVNPKKENDTPQRKELGDIPEGNGTEELDLNNLPLNLPLPLNIKQEEIKLEEGMEKSYGCKECKRDYHTKRQLSRHNYKVHKLTIRGPHNSTGPKKGKPCFFCPTAYPNITRLISHLSTMHKDKNLASLADMIPSLNAEDLDMVRMQQFVFPKKEAELVVTSSEDETGGNADITFIEKTNTAKKDIIDAANMKCDFCPLDFETFSQLLCHVRYGHKDVDRTNADWRIKMFYALDAKWPSPKQECDFIMPSGLPCGKMVKEERIQRHMYCHKVGPRTCDECNKTVQRKSWKRHMERHTKGDREWMCAECAATFDNKHSYRRHVVIHSPNYKKLECSECHKFFQNNQYLARHHKKVHTKHLRQAMACDQCPFKTYSGEKGLQLHIKGVHENDRQHLCSFCPYATITSNNLSNHIKRVHTREKPHTCGLCEYQCCTKLDLDRHMFAMHDKDNHHKCDVCGWTTPRPHLVVKHLRVKHGIIKPMDVDNVPFLQNFNPALDMDISQDIDASQGLYPTQNIYSGQGLYSTPNQYSAQDMDISQNLDLTQNLNPSQNIYASQTQGPSESSIPPQTLPQQTV